MGDIDRKVTLSVDLDSSRAESGLKRVADAGGRVGKEVSAAWSAATPQLEAVNKRLLEMGVRFQETGLISQRALATVGVQLRSLTDEYGKTASATDRLTAAERNFLSTAQGAYKEAIARSKEYNDELERVNRQTRNWTSFQGALEAIGGRFGDIVKVATGVTAALTAGWQMGRKLDTWLEENVSGWKRWRDQAADSIVAVTEKLRGLSGAQMTPGQLLAPIGPKGEQTQFQMLLGQAAQSLGVKTLADVNAELAKFQNQMRVVELSGMGLSKFFEDNKTKIEDWVASLRAAGKNVPSWLEGIVKGWAAIKAAQDAAKKSAEDAAKAQEDFARRSATLWGSQGAGFAGFVEQRGSSVATSLAMQRAGIFDDAERWLDEQQRKEKDAREEQNDRFIEELKQTLIFGSEAMAHALKDAGNFVSDALVDFGLKGGKNFGQIVESYVAKGASDGFKQLFAANGPLAGLFSGALGPQGLDVSGYYNQGLGAYINPQTGQPFQGATPQQQRLAAQSYKLNQYINGSLQAAGAIYNSLTNGSTNDLGGFAQDAITYAGIGAQMGGVIGGIIGVIVAGIVQAFKPSMVDIADFAQYNVRGGRASYLENTVSQAASDIQARKVQDAVNSTFNAFTSVILRFPAEMLSKLIVPITSIGVYGGKWDPAEGGHITGYGKTDFQNALKDFNAWLAGTLPDEIAKAFKPALEQGFKALGLTNTAFERYWEQMKGVDPAKAQEFWSNLVDFLNTWNDIQASMANINASTVGGVAGWYLNPDGSQRIPGQSDYMQSLSQAETHIRDLAAAVATLTGPDQIAAAKQLGDSVKSVMTSLVEYLNLVGTTAKAIHDDIHNRLLALGLDQAKGNKQAQQDLLWAEFKRIDEEIKNAARLGLSPDQLRADVSQAANLAGQIYGLAPDAAHADWYRRQLEQLQNISDQQLQQMADTAKTEVEKLIAQVQPFVDYVNGVPNDLDPAFTAAEDALVSFADALNLLSGRITNDTDYSTGEHSAHPRNWVWDPTAGKWVPPGTNPDLLPATANLSNLSAGIVGELRIYVNDVAAGSVDLSSEGFARRTVIARGRR